MAWRQQEDELMDALMAWLESRPADANPKVVVALDVDCDSLNYVISSQSIMMKRDLLQHALAAVPTPMPETSTIQAFARVDIQTHMKLSQSFNSSPRILWYRDEAQKLHKIMSFARRRWRKLRATGNNSPLSMILQGLDDGDASDMQLESTSASSSISTASTSSTFAIPPYPVNVY